MDKVYVWCVWMGRKRRMTMERLRVKGYEETLRTFTEDVQTDPNHELRSGYVYFLPEMMTYQYLQWIPDRGLLLSSTNERLVKPVLYGCKDVTEGVELLLGEEKEAWRMILTDWWRRWRDRWSEVSILLPHRPLEKCVNAVKAGDISNVTVEDLLCLRRIYLDVADETSMQCDAYFFLRGLLQVLSRCRSDVL